jgi:hypothetical protein
MKFFHRRKTTDEAAPPAAPFVVLAKTHTGHVTNVLVGGIDDTTTLGDLLVLTGGQAAEVRPLRRYV